MAEPRSDKVAEVEALEERLRNSSIVILTDYRGLTVGEIGTLRGKLRGASLEYRVAKNTLLSRAAENVGVVGLEPHLTGPTAVVFGNDDPGVPARVLQDFIRQFRKLEIKGGVVEGHALDAAGVQALATLPGRPELLARVVGAVQGPLFSLVMVLTAAPRGLVTALDAIRKRRETEEGASGKQAASPAEPAPSADAAPVADAAPAPEAAPAPPAQSAPASEGAPAEPAAVPAADAPAESKPTA
ncbi:MAG TPA: 50S ribosomal protein L10 [Gaiellales bacterium]|nr:50S ribosomal protein L10 [Gaiellales bacterium]